MSNSGNAHREQLKERARLARASQVQDVEVTPTEPLFGRPRRISPAPDDSTALRACDLLGPYDVVQPSIQTNPRSYYGVSQGCNTAAGQKIAQKLNGVITDKKASNSSSDPGRDKTSKQDSASRGGKKELNYSKNGHQISESEKVGPKIKVEKEDNALQCGVNAEKDIKPSVEDLEKYLKKTLSDGSNKVMERNSNTHQSHCEKEGHHENVSHDQRSQKSLERESTGRRSAVSSLEKDIKVEDQTAAHQSRHSRKDERRSGSKERRSLSSGKGSHSSEGRNGSGKTRGEGHHVKSHHKDGNIFSLMKSEHEEKPLHKDCTPNTSVERKPSKHESEGVLKCSGSSVQPCGNSVGDDKGGVPLKIKEEPVDGSMHPPNGVRMLASSRAKDAYKNLPKLKMLPAEVKAGMDSHPEKLEAEDILKEMKPIPLLTAIQTPGKEERLKFPFSKDISQVTKNVFQSRKSSNSYDGPHPLKKEKSHGSSDVLLKDLAVSDSESDDDQIFAKKKDTDSKLGKRPTTQSRSRSSSSESSANGSESSSESESESDSNSSDDEEGPHDTGQKEEETQEHQTQNETWGLRNFMNKLKENNATCSPSNKMTPPVRPAMEGGNDYLDDENWADSLKYITSDHDDLPPLIQQIDEQQNVAAPHGRKSLFSTDEEEPDFTTAPTAYSPIKEVIVKQRSDSDMDISDDNAEEHEIVCGIENWRDNEIDVVKTPQKSVSESPNLHAFSDVQIGVNGGIKLKIGRKMNNDLQTVPSCSESTKLDQDLNISISAAIKSPKTTTRLKKQASTCSLPCVPMSELVKMETISESRENTHPRKGHRSLSSSSARHRSTPKSESKSSDISVSMVDVHSQCNTPKSNGRTSVKSQKIKSKAFLNSDDSSDSGEEMLNVPVKTPTGCEKFNKDISSKPRTPSKSSACDNQKRPVERRDKPKKERQPCSEQGCADKKQRDAASFPRTFKAEPLNAYNSSHGMEVLHVFNNTISGDLTLLSPIPNTVPFSPSREFSFDVGTHVRDNRLGSCGEPQRYEEKGLTNSCQTDLQRQSLESKPSSEYDTMLDTNRLSSHISYNDEGTPSIMVHLDRSLIRRLPRREHLYMSECSSSRNIDGDHIDNVFVPQNQIKSTTSFVGLDGPGVQAAVDNFEGEDGELSPSASSESEPDVTVKARAAYNKEFALPVTNMEYVPHDTTVTSHGGIGNSEMHNNAAAYGEDRDEGEIIDDGESSPETMIAPCGKVPYQAKKEKMNAQKDVLNKILGDRPALPAQKIPKRKMEDMRQDDVKRPKAMHSRYHVSDVIYNRESSSHEDDREWDRKHHRSRERRNSGSSTSSRHSSRSERDAKRILKEHDKYNNFPREPDHRDFERDYEVFEKGRPFGHQIRDWDAPSPVRHDSQSSNSCGAFNSVGFHSASDHWGAITGHLERRTSYSNPAETLRSEEEKQETADHYLLEAKKLKHQADNLSDRLTKSLTYVEAVLSFIQCGNAMEVSISDGSNIFTMYRDTLNLLRNICKFRSHSDNEVGDKEKRLSVLSLRIQSLLCLKLFKLKKNEAQKLRKVIEDHNKTSKTPAQAPSPYQMQWNRSTGTPSPMSPSPSPLSVCSMEPGSGMSDPLMSRHVGSQISSGYSSNSAMSSPASISIPQRIHSVTQLYITTLNHLHQCHDLWDQADGQSSDHKAFFDELDYHCGALTLHSSILHLVKYVRLGLHRLKDT